jgi:hypothetical protein
MSARRADRQGRAAWVATGSQFEIPPHALGMVGGLDPAPCGFLTQIATFPRDFRLLGKLLGKDRARSESICSL